MREAIAKLDATLPLARQREADVKGLVEQGFINLHAGQDRTRERIEMERDLATQRARLTEAAAAIRETDRTRPPTWPKPGAPTASDIPRPR